MLHVVSLLLVRDLSEPCASHDVEQHASLTPLVEQCPNGFPPMIRFIRLVGGWMEEESWNNRSTRFVLMASCAIGCGGATKRAECGALVKKPWCGSQSRFVDVLSP